MNEDMKNRLTELVATRSVNSLGRSDRPAASPPMVDRLEGWLREAGIACDRQTVDREINLIARLEGADGGRTVLFDAHTDTVPADDWADRAFTPRLEGDRLYGRGSCDTKASLVAMLDALLRLSRLPQNRRPNTITLLASADEEFGRTGLRAFLAGCPRIDAAVVGEPTLCRPVIACKGAARWEIITRGQSAHSSTPRKGVNAINRMARVIGELEAYERDVLSAKQHPLVDPATITVSVISGGTAVNVVPAECRVQVDLRTMPAENPADAARATIEHLRARLDFDVEHAPPHIWSGADVAADHPFTRQCTAACSAVLGTDTTPTGVNYGCHASDFADGGVPAVIIGPGDIAVAHAIDEYVELSSVEQAAEIYYRIMTGRLELP